MIIPCQNNYIITWPYRKNKTIEPYGNLDSNGTKESEINLGGMYKPRGQMRGEGGCSDDHNT